MPANPSCFPPPGQCDTIRFSIVSASLINDRVVALAVVTAVNQGFTIDDVPGRIGLLNDVDIYDPVGCFFNEPLDFLIGRGGWAHYMQPLPHEIPDDGSPYNEPQWEVFALCCNVGSCA